jgi:hypothetical protein
MHEETTNRLDTRNACYHSIQNLLLSHVLPKNINIKIQRITILPVVLHGCEKWSPTLGDEYRLKVFKNRVLTHLELQGRK